MPSPAQRQSDSKSSQPPLRLSRDVDEPERVAEATPPVAGFAVQGESLSVAPQTQLPNRCVLCGDSMDLIALRTFRGHIRYSICREHSIVAGSKALAGLVMVLLMVACVGSQWVGEPLVNSGGLKFSILLGIAGMALVYWALPLRVGKLAAGQHRLSRINPEVIAELQRNR